MSNIFRIKPSRNNYIPDVLPNGKRIEDVTDMPLNRNEFLKCRAYADVFALIGNPPKEIFVSNKTYEEAVALFDEIKDIISEPEKDPVNEQDKAPENNDTVAQASDINIPDEKQEADNQDIVKEAPKNSEASTGEEEHVAAPEENPEEDVNSDEQIKEDDVHDDESAEDKSDVESDKKENEMLEKNNSQHVNNVSQNRTSQNGKNEYTNFDKKLKNKNRK